MLPLTESSVLLHKMGLLTIFCNSNTEWVLLILSLPLVPLVPFPVLGMSRGCLGRGFPKAADSHSGEATLAVLLPISRDAYPRPWAYGLPHPPRCWLLWESSRSLSFDQTHNTLSTKASMLITFDYEWIK